MRNAIEILFMVLTVIAGFGCILAATIEPPLMRIYWWLLPVFVIAARSMALGLI